LQHGAPGGKLHPRAAIEAPQRPFDPRPVARDQLIRLVVQQILQRAGEGEQRRFDGGEGAGGVDGGFLHRIDGGTGGALHAAVGLGVGAGSQLGQERGKKGLHRADRLGRYVVAIHVRQGRDAARPSLSGQGGGGAHNIAEGGVGGVVIGKQVAQALLQPPPTPAPLRPANPAAQLRRLLARKAGGEGRIGGVEQVMAFVEHHALQGRRLPVGLLAPRGAGAVEGGLGQHQSVVGDDDVGPAAGADRLLHETGAVVGAGSVDALAPPVDQVGRPGLRHWGYGEQVRQPGGEVAAGHVPVPRSAHPAAGKARAD
jgi:hypothetical protein